MPFQLLNPTTGPINPPMPSTLQRIGSAVAGPVMGTIDGYRNSIGGAYQTWFGSDKAVDIPTSAPYSGWKPLSDACILSVCGQAIPDGIVMTHCQVRSSLEYRATPISEAVTYQSRFGVRPNAKGEATVAIVVNATGTSAEEQALTDEVSAKSKEIQALAVAQAKARGTVVKDPNTGKPAVNVEDLVRTLNELYEKRLNAISAKRDQAKFGKASAKFRKVHVGDNLPRVLELRFTVMDVLGDGALLASRYDQLKALHRLLCQNPSVKESGTVPDGQLLSEAAKVTADSVSGRLVRLSSKGIDPYGVDIWACTSFVHREVPDTDLVFVQATFSEYESLFKSEPPAAAAPPAQAAPAAIVAPPAAPTKPSYSPTGKWAEIPSP